MLRNPGWCCFIQVQGQRQYVVSFLDGQPVFSFELAAAQYMDEYDARQLAVMVGREFDDVRVLYVPVSARRELGVMRDCWSINYGR